MALLGGEEKDKKTRPNLNVGDIVLLHAKDQPPAPAVVLGLGENDVLDVNDLSGSYGRLYGIKPKTDDSDPLVLSWTARG
jgi:hypothetical protein